MICNFENVGLQKTIMKNPILLALFLVLTAFAQAQINMPQPSPTQTIIQNFGMGKVELVYSRPSIKGRTLLQDNSVLAPYGKVWRTGANAATKIVFDQPVSFGGKQLDTGAYAILTIPGKQEWTIMLTKGLDKAATEYTQQDDVARISAKPETRTPPVETFTMNFAELKPESCELHLRWGTTLVKIPITVNLKDKLRTQVEQALQSANEKPHWQAANFYYEIDKNYTKALENVNAALNENKDAYFMYLLKAKILKELGDKNNAKAAAQQAITTATAAKNDDYVRQANDVIKSL